MSGEQLDQASMEDFRAMAAVLVRVEALIVEWEAKAQRSLEFAERGGPNWTEHMTRRTTWQAATRSLRAALAHPDTDPAYGPTEGEL